MAHDVFISYASGDKAVADAVCATLESQDIRCWIAPRDVLPGIHYGEAIIDAIHECRIMVLVFSSKANLSGHIPKEIERAVSQGVTVMPLRIENVAPAKSLDYFIGSVHWLDALTPPLEVHLQKLAANVQTLLSRDHPGTEASVTPVRSSGTAYGRTVAPQAASRPSRPQWTHFVIAGLTTMLLILGIFLYRSRSHANPAPAPSAVSLPAPLPVPPPTLAPDKQKKLLAPVSTAVSAAAPAPKPTPRADTPPRIVNLHYIPQSTLKLAQIIGDEDRETHKPTTTQTLTRFGIEGTELGNSFEHDGRLYFLFGPSVGRLPRKPSTIATSDTTNPEAGMHLDFLTSGGSDVAVQPPDVTMTLQDAPVAGISLNAQMYVTVTSNSMPGKANVRSVLTKFVAPSTFQTVRTVSELPAGRFIRMSLHAQPGPVAGLPAGGPFILAWGTAKYRESDVFLSITPETQFEGGKGVRYFAGLDASNAPTWSDNESDATPLTKDGTVGDVSVTWCKDLGLWLMTYDRRSQLPGIAFSYSRTPWGPWSEPELLFNAMRDNGFGKFIHNPRRITDDGLAGPVRMPRNMANAAEIFGGAYAPYVVERWTKLEGSTLNLYYVMSTNNPYVVVQMKSRLQVE